MYRQLSVIPLELDTSLTIIFVGRQNEWTIPPDLCRGMTNSPTISQGQDSPLAVNTAILLKIPNRMSSITMSFHETK